MSNDTIHIIITIGIIALMFSWVPFINIICPPGWRSEERSSAKTKDKEVHGDKVSVSSLTSRRLADKSRDFLDALSSREGRGIPRSGGSVRNVPPGSCAE
jgi:hypothetical protein